MEENYSGSLTFWGRLKMACRVLFRAGYVEELLRGLKELEVQGRKAANPDPPERVHASALFLLGALQREGRLIDFLQQEVAEFSDGDVGAAARVIHGGCKRVLHQYFAIAPVMAETEGAPVSVAKGFDPQRIRLTGNVTGKPPFRGTLKHHGWVTSDVKVPVVGEAVDPKVLAPAEVELA